MKKRITAPRPKKKVPARSCDSLNEDSSYGDKAVKPIMKSVLDGCQHKEIDPSSCVPLYLFRKKSNNAVKKLKAIFEGNFSSSRLSLPGIVAGTSSSVVVPLIGDLEHLICDSFIAEGYEECDLKELKSQHDHWYGVIDGNQFLAAIMELRREIPEKWCPFRWNVTVIKEGKTLSEYRKLARIQNERNKTVYHFESTVYDLLHGLRLEYNLLYDAACKNSRTGKRGVKINHRSVAHNYDGGDHYKSTYVKQAVTVASRLAPETINAIGQVCNMECPDIILTNSSLNRKDLKSVEEIVSQSDCRLFKSFICFGSLRGAQAFMNAVLDDLVEEQVNCIHRLRHWCESNNFKSVQTKTVVEQFNFSILSLKEEKKFLDLLGNDEWPPHMETTRENVLRTTLCDTELAMNSGNGNDILPSIWKSFKRLHPGKAVGIENASIEDSNLQESVEQPSSSDPPPAPDDSSEIDKESAQRREEEERVREETIRREAMRTKGDTFLHESNIFTKKMDFDDYLTEVWTCTSPRVDLVLSAISKSESLDKVQKIPAFCKTVLKTGCYAFLIVSNYHYTVLEKAFTDEGFKVMDYCFIIVYDKSTMQRRITTDFPQRHGDIAILAKMPGIHPAGYTPIFSDKDAEQLSDDVVKYASMINITCCRDKLRKPKEIGALRKDERSVQLYSHVIKMLTPVGGSVIDPLGGACTATIVCMETKRSCVCLESDTQCYSYAIGRARIFATPGATMADLSDYAEPIDVDELTDNDLNPPLKKRRTNDKVCVEETKFNGLIRTKDDQNSSDANQNTEPIFQEDPSQTAITPSTQEKNVSDKNDISGFKDIQNVCHDDGSTETEKQSAHALLLMHSK